MSQVADLPRDAEASQTPLEALVLSYQRTRCHKVFDQIRKQTEGLLRHAARPVFRRSRWAESHVQEVLDAGLEGLWRAALAWDGSRAGFVTFSWQGMYWAMLSCSRQAESHQKGAVSLDTMLADKDGSDLGSLGELITDSRGEAPEVGPDRQDLQVVLADLVDRVCMPREARLIRLRYWQGLKLRELAEAEGCTRERARQIIERGLVRLRQAARRGELPGVLPEVGAPAADDEG